MLQQPDQWYLVIQLPASLKIFTVQHVSVAVRQLLQGAGEERPQVIRTV